MDNQKKEYQILNLLYEYGTELNGCKYAVASELNEIVLRDRYKVELKCYEPFIYLTQQQADVIEESNRNEAKHRMRAIRRADAFGYEDGVTELFHIGAVTRCMEDELIKAHDQIDFIKIYNRLNGTQKNRVWLYVMEGMSQTEIAKMEGVSVAAVHYSVKTGLKKLKKILENT